MNKISTLVLLSFSLGLVLSDSKVCRALCLSGGGNKGAYQAGSLYALSHQLKDQLGAEDIQYDVFSGVSAGSINAFTLSFFEKGKEAEMAEFLSQYW